jgi:hypothetical protein
MPGDDLHTLCMHGVLPHLPVEASDPIDPLYFLRKLSTRERLFSSAITIDRLGKYTLKYTLKYTRRSGYVWFRFRAEWTNAWLLWDLKDQRWSTFWSTLAFILSGDKVYAEDPISRNPSRQSCLIPLGWAIDQHSFNVYSNLQCTTYVQLRQNEKLTLVLTFSDKYNKHARRRWTTSSHPRMGTLAWVRVSMEQLYAPNIY